jgi:trimethylamine---corrinoid protein Co-methyltransferase
LKEDPPRMNGAPKESPARKFAGSSRQWLTEKQQGLLHDASLEIMAGIGMRFCTERALALFRKAGAGISDGNLVRIPPALTEKALTSVPRDVVIYDRNGRPAMSFGDGACYFGVGSDCAYLYDPQTGERRKALLKDLRHAVRLVDSLSNLDFLMSMFIPADVPPQTYERHQMKAMLELSIKPIVFCGIEGGSTESAVAMAAAVAGGLQSLQRHPFILNYVNTVSPFCHNAESVARLLYAAERNLPTIYAPANCRGTTAPMTAAGMMALGNAGALAGLVLSQLAREGSPYIMNHPSVGALDMRWMRDLFVSPDKGPAGCDMAHRYRVPVFCSGGCSDAKLFDAQAAAEAALTLFAGVVSGANMIQNIGYLDSAMTGSMELMVLCDEIIGWMKRYLRDIEISEETLALETIRQVGPDGDFLDTEHTVRHLRDDWMPALFDRASYEKWVEEGRSTLEQRANRKVHSVLQDHHAEPLPEGVRAALETLLTSP